MENYSSEKLKILLWLAVRQSPRLQTADLEPDADAIFDALAAQMPAASVTEFEYLRAEYQKKSTGEKQKWLEQTRAIFDADEKFYDVNIHWSHIEAALRETNPAIREIIVADLPAKYRWHFASSENKSNGERARVNSALERKIRRNFFGQFVAQADLSAVGAFDRLSGEEFARLARLAGTREVALACVRIRAVESVAAFLRRFPAENARAIAAQLSDLPEVSGERLDFAERLVQTALEIESNPSAMLDLLGVRLVGISLCGESVGRVAYTTQKLPLEFAPKLSEIIEDQCRQTAPELQKAVSAEIERLAAAISRTVETAV